MVYIYATTDWFSPENAPAQEILINQSFASAGPVFWHIVWAMEWMRITYPIQRAEQDVSGRAGYVHAYITLRYLTLPFLALPDLA